MSALQRRMSRIGAPAGEIKGGSISKNAPVGVTPGAMIRRLDKYGSGKGGRKATLPVGPMNPLKRKTK